MTSDPQWIYLQTRRFLRSSGIRTVGMIGELLAKLSIFIAVIVWLVEIPDRAQQRIDTAWVVVNSTSGKPGSLGRGPALTLLNSKALSLAYVDLSHAILIGIDLRHADLRGANFNGADLTNAQFGCSLWSFVFHSRCTIFDHASFENACLDHADFHNTRIWGTVFSHENENTPGDLCLNPNTRETDFSGASISDHTTFRAIDFINVNFSGAHINWSTFENVSFKTPFSDDVHAFDEAEIRGVDFTKTNVSMRMLRTAKICDVKLPDGSINNRDCQTF